MDLRYLYTSFAGRIGRKQWWIGTIILIVTIVLVYFLVFPFIGLSPMSVLLEMSDSTPPADFMVSMMRRMALGQLILVALVAYPATALMKKRLNDRDRPDWLIYVFWAPTVVSLLMNLVGVGYTMSEASGMMVPESSALGAIVGVATFVVGLWQLVELGFLKGTNGPNQHGPDPRAA